MLANPVAEAARRRIARICHAGLDAPALLAGLAAEVRAVVGYDGAVWATVDPATLLITGAHVEELPRESAPAFYENEYLHDDVLKFSRLARGVRPVASMSEATGGDLGRSRLHRELGSVFGFPGDALRAAFVAGGSCWGAAALARSDPAAHFTQSDLSFVASLCAHAAEGLRAATLLDALAVEPPGAAADGPGLLVLDGDRVRSASAAGGRWLEELAADFGRGPGDRLPAAVLAVAGAAGQADGSGDPPPSTRAVLRTRAGRWLALQGVRMDGGAEPAIAVIIEPARPRELAPVVMSAYGLTPRERDVAQQVIAGASTAEAAAALHISPYTLQDHLKAIFDKVGVRSRGELVKQVHERHYAPRGLRTTRGRAASRGPSPSSSP